MDGFSGFLAVACVIATGAILSIAISATKKSPIKD